MFTGIIEELGTVAAITQHGGSAELALHCTTVIEDAGLGDSIAVNGACLTVTRLLDGADGAQTGFAADLMGETLKRSALADLQPGDPVNLERALRADGRLGGHVVQGHVDAVGDVLQITEHGEWTEWRFSLPTMLAPLLVEKGSIAIDGTSLTVMGVQDVSFTVGLIPHTLAATVFGVRKVGDRVNLEADILAKHVERLLSLRSAVNPNESSDGDPVGKE